MTEPCALTMTDEQRALVDQIARQAATEALRQVGLHDEGAGDDVRELRDLLTYWRDAKRSLLRRIAGWIGTALLALGAAFMGLKWGASQ